MWSHQGYTIDIDSNGQFSAVIADDLTLSCQTLAGVRQMIDEQCKEKRAEIKLPVVCIASGKGYASKGKPHLSRCNITGINRTTRDLTFDLSEKGQEVDEFLPDTEENARVLEQLIAARLTVQALDAEVGGRSINHQFGYGRLPIGEYQKFLKELCRNYKEAKARG